jgi:DNA-binding transcriptional LysR family regulator
MNFDILTLECFVAVAETGSFTHAATRVGRTQSAVSQQIAKLEHHLGKTLFVRNKNLMLSPNGEVLLSYAQQIIKLQREVLERFREPELKGELRFGLPEDFATLFLSDVLKGFSSLHPLILLNIECDLTVNLFNRFKEKEFDLVLVKMNKSEDFPHSFDVWSESMKWVGKKELIDENKPIPLVLSPKPCVYRAASINALEKSGRSWRLVFCSPSYAGTVAAVKAGMGITVMPHTMIPKELEAISTPILPELNDMHVSLLKHKADNPVVNSMEEFILRKLK